MDAEKVKIGALAERVEHVRTRPEAVGVRLCRDGCGSFACAVCGPVVGLRLSERLENRYRAAGVDRVGLFTLSISDKVLPYSAGEQYRKIVERRLIGEFVRELRSVLGVSGAYFRICEFGAKTQRLHFHLLVDDLRKINRADLVRLQAWCQTHIGTMDYKHLPVGAGIRYACKYLTKGSSQTLPDFVLDSAGFKFHSASHGFWLTPSRPRKERNEPPEKRKQRCLRVRLAACGDGVIGLAQVAGPDGEIAQSFAFALPIPFERVVEALVRLAKDQVHAVGSAWPVGVQRWVEVDADCVRGLLATAVCLMAGGRRAAQRLGGREP